MQRRFVHALVCLAWLAAAVLPAGAAPPKAFVGNFKDNTVSVIDTAQAAVTATIPVAAGPHGMVITPSGRTVYVSGDASSQVNEIDTATDRVVRTLEVGRTPHGLALADNGRLLLVAVYGEDRVAVFDTASALQSASIAVPKPHTIAVIPGGGKAYVASQEPGHFGVAVIDLKQSRVAQQLPLDKPPRDIEAAYDGRAVYFTIAGENAVQVLDPRTDRIVGRVPTGASPHVASLFRGAPAGVAVVQGPGELTLFDPATYAVLRSIPVGKQPHWAAAAGSGAQVFVTNEGSNDVTVVELASGATRTVAVGAAPRKIVVQNSEAAATSGSSRVSIANFAFAPPEITIAPGQTVTWTNDDGAPHGLAFADGGAGQDLLLPGASYARRYDAPGSFDYACSVHPYMTGRVVVRNR